MPVSSDTGKSNPQNHLMARSKSKLTGYMLVAALVGAGAYFHEQIIAQFNKVKEAVTK